MTCCASIQKRRLPYRSSTGDVLPGSVLILDDLGGGRSLARRGTLVAVVSIADRAAVFDLVLLARTSADAAV